MRIIDHVRALRAQWPIARRYRYRWDLLVLTVSDVVEKFWLCRVRRQHRQKFSSGGRCIRCGHRITAP